ncbi:MAG: MT-A70 family methyltransferase [Nostoc sp.]|uniref:MT-A70 family methyltransferase n=1 Tax=Nostoc sp. TaxID=1180 RepID=UPI002FF58D4E
MLCFFLNPLWTSFSRLNGKSQVEKLCPDMTKLEMFARSSRVGWDCWGDEADLFDQLGAEIDNDTSLSA